MTSSISSTAQDSIQLMMQQMYQKIGAADTDGTAGLSKDELSSIDSSGDVGGSAFLKSLSEQFDTLDVDGNGQLSTEEISSAKPSEPMGPPPGLPIADSSTDSSDMSDLIEKLMESLLEKLSESYESDSTDESGDSANKVSSLTSAADKDGSGSVSLDELSSVDSGDNVGQAGFVNDLVNNFDTYDTNSDGQLSQDEMIAAMPTEKTADASNSASSFKSMASSFIEKLLSAYKNSDVTSTASSFLSEAI